MAPSGWTTKASASSDEVEKSMARGTPPPGGHADGWPASPRVVDTHVGPVVAYQDDGDAGVGAGWGATPTWMPTLRSSAPPRSTTARPPVPKPGSSWADIGESNHDAVPSPEGVTSVPPTMTAVVLAGALVQTDRGRRT